MSKIVLITGANKGIGQEFCRLLAESKSPIYKIIIAGRNDQLLNETLTILKKDYPNSYFDKTIINLNDPISQKTSFEQIKKNQKYLDILVNNAGMAFKGDIFNIDVAKTTIGTNQDGTKNLTLTLFELLESNPNKPSIILNVCSQSGLQSQQKLSKNISKKCDSIKCIQDIDNFVNDFYTDIQNNNVNGNWPKQTQGISKLAEIKLTQILSLMNAGVQCVGCCPGWCKSDMAGWEKPPKTGREGAQVQLQAIHNVSTSQNGKFYFNGKYIHI